MKTKAACTGFVLLWLLGSTAVSEAQRISYPPEEFAARRQALCESVGNQGFILMFGKTVVPAGVRVRQDNDFYYLTGAEDLNAVLFMNAASCAATLFLPSQTEREASRDGWNMLYAEGAALTHGFAAI